jgi:hypothetical protein
MVRLRTLPWLAVRPVVDALDPSYAVATRAARRIAPRLAIGVVYRARNAATVMRFLDAHPGARAALWALDEPHPALDAITVGVGGGTRFALQNRLAQALAPEPGEWLVMADDDVLIERGDLTQVAALAERLGLNLCQPAHSHRSFVSWPTTRRRPLKIARATRWVEIGPIVLFDRAARDRVLPFPELGMGWGVEAEWAAHDDLRMGLVDAIRMRHLVPSQKSYDTGSEQQDLEDRYARLGVTEADVDRMRLPVRSWYCWSPLRP